MILFDYLIFVALYLVVGAIVISIFIVKTGFFKQKFLFFLALIFRMIVTFAYYYTTLITYSADTFTYHGRAQASVGRWSELFLTTGTQFMSYLTTLVFYPLVSMFDNTYLMLFVPFSILSFIGSLIFYKALRQMGIKDSVFLNFFIFFLPNLVYWTSSIGKDAVVYFAFAWIFLSFVNLKKEIIPSFIKIILLGVLLYFIRPHIVACFIGALFFGLFLEKNVLSFKNVAIFIIIFFVFNMVVGKVFQGTDVEGENLESYTQAGLGQLQEMGTRSAEDDSQRSTIKRQVSSNVLLMPLYAFWWLTVPYLWQASKAGHYVAVLDGLIMQYILFYLIWHIKSIIESKGLPYKYFWIMYSFVAAAVFGMSQSNFGLIVRQRLMVVPFLIVLYLVIRSEKKSPVKIKKGSIKIDIDSIT